MKPSYITAFIVGALTGVVLALSLMLYVGATGGVPSVSAVVDGTRVVPVFAAPASALWIMVILASAFGGFVAAAATKAVSRAIDPDAASASLAVIAPLGIVVAPVIGMAVFPLGVVVLGSIDEGTTTLGVVEMVALAGLTGLVAGGLVVWLSYILARPPIAQEDTSIHMDMVDRSA
jgi:hypothetical protein